LTPLVTALGDTYLSGATDHSKYCTGRFMDVNWAPGRPTQTGEACGPLSLPLLLMPLFLLARLLPNTVMIFLVIIILDVLQ